MAYTNFKPKVWAKAIERERDLLSVSVALCDRSYEKEASVMGNSIQINWTKRPTVKSYTVGTNISNPETLEGDTTKTIELNQLKYVNFMVDDVDELQSAPDIMESCMHEAASAIAADADKYVHSLAINATNVITEDNVTVENIGDIVSSAAQMLYENNVPQNEEIFLEVSPAIYQLMWKAKVLRETPNSDTFGSGFVGMFDNFKVYMNNCIIKDMADYYSCIARTRKAIAFVGQMKKMEAYRPQGLFADAVKGLHVYGATLVRPDEIVKVMLKFPVASSN